MKSSKWSVVAGIGLSRRLLAKTFGVAARGRMISVSARAPGFVALPARRVRESAGLAKAFGVGSAMRRRIAFNRGANPEAVRGTGTHFEGPAPTGQKGKPLDASRSREGLPNPRLNKSKNEIDTLSRIRVKTMLDS